MAKTTATKSTEILINSTHVTHNNLGDAYEFVLDDSLQVVECVKVNSLAKNIIHPIENSNTALDGMLFELNHVRVNPRVDNTYIISCLTTALNNIGVVVSNPPEADSIALCFKPLGEISDNVRFYLSNHGRVVFLSPSTKPKLVASSNVNLRRNRP